MERFNVDRPLVRAAENKGVKRRTAIYPTGSQRWNSSTAGADPVRSRQRASDLPVISQGPRSNRLDSTINEMSVWPLCFRHVHDRDIPSLRRGYLIRTSRPLADEA